MANSPKPLVFLQMATTLRDRARQAQTGTNAYLQRILLGAPDMSKPIGLTVLRLKALEPRDKPYEVRDPAVTGGYVVVWPSRALSYVVRFRFQNASRKVTLGKFDADAGGLAEIRAKAREAQNQLTQARKPSADALDPAAAKKAARLAATQTLQRERSAAKAAKEPQPDAFAKVVETYLATHGRNLRDSTRKEIARLFNKELSAWREKRLLDITTLDVHTVLDAITARNADITANRLHSYLRHFFVWAKGRKIIEVSPLEGVTKPTSEKNRARERALDDAELAIAWKGASTLRFPFGPFFRLAILTGARRNELSGMKWTEIDFEKALWIIPKERSKNGQEHQLPLAPQVVALLQSLPRFTGPYVFSHGDAPVSGHSKAKWRLDQAIVVANGGQPLKEFVVHDLRRSFATGLQRLGVRMEVTERLLNHVGESHSGIRRVYQRHSYAKEMREAAEHWASHVEQITSAPAPTPSNVIAIATGRRA